MTAEPQHLVAHPEGVHLHLTIECSRCEQWLVDLALPLPLSKSAVVLVDTLTMGSQPCGCTGEDGEP